MDAIASFRLDGQLALVTGATAGLGFAIAEAFSAAGATVAVHGRDEGRVHRACEKIANAVPIIFDLRDMESAEEALSALAAEHGTVTIMVGNAAMRDRQTLRETSPLTLLELLEVNLVANFQLAQHLVPGMISAGGGRIIFITTVGAIRGSASGSTYAASKGGLASLTRSLAVELGSHGICVNAISPGFFATEYNQGLQMELATKQKVRARVPLQRWGAPQDIAGPALLLASGAGAYMTGHHLVVDGGFSIAS